MVMEEDDQGRELFRKSRLENEEFYRECVEQVMRLSDSILEERNRELETSKADIENARSTLSDLNQSIEGLDSKKRSLEDEIERLASSLEQARSEQEAALGEIQSNIAFRLGPVSYTHLDVYKRQVLAVATTATVRFTNSNGTEYQQPSKHTW